MKDFNFNSPAIETLAAVYIIHRMAINVRNVTIGLQITRLPTDYHEPLFAILFFLVVSG
ncbi:hypothetical protein AtNW77_Chr3g0159651 [Arabidopsis thaliana]